MSFNSLKLELLLSLYLNHFSKDCPCQHCRYSCHNYRLSQIDSTKRKRKTHQGTRLHSPTRRTPGQQLRGKTTENQEEPNQRKIANKDSILIERESPETKKKILAKKSLVPQTSLHQLRKNQERIQETTEQTRKTSLNNRALTKDSRILEWSQNLPDPQEIEKNP